ncbi:PREDICTED: uncharacterized protein LOC109583897 isoform X2 [Amphimedon queenslandica]|uniref:Asteroid domain-containing protein n=1 Tax=Amphimedon queenslandica TaxID=400682 RepID=A0AAN0JDX9_AMPQE|nr:PREDICTED: uncharacterized protein LOC109583897 isoform X2 [Amphimedon queenslandica]|eukprot:XP_019854966.1 PREDICTED: uncharacterized protein LOC109583897 isoform X2 [Amphimedon queenslandica]
MGVKGLLKYIRNCPTGVRPEPLVLSTETKRKSRDPTAAKAILVCDFIAIVFWLLDIVHDAKKSSERYIALYGADFKEYTSRLIRFVEMLRHIDIEPVFFCDGPRGSGKEYEMKLSTWEKRTKDSLKVILSHSFITKYDAKTEVKFGKKIMQPLLVTELVMALQEAKVELITCEGEADNLMAEYMRTHGNVCGILTNDTDMMLMDGVTAIHYKLFDQENALKLSDDDIPDDYKIAEVHCGAISPGYLARRLKIDEKCLPAFSVLCGNDFTTDLNDEIDVKKLVFGYINYNYVKTYEYTKTVLKWIKDNEEACKDPVSFLAIREIADVCKKNPRYAAAVHYSYAFYTCSHPMPASSGDSSVSTAASPLCDFIASEVKIDRMCLPVVRNGILWRDEIEQLDEKLCCIYDVLQPVRTIIYKLLCCKSVTEFGQSKIDECVPRPIDVPSPCVPEDLDTLRKEISHEQKISLLVEVFKKPDHIVLLKSFAKSFKDIPPTSRVPDIGSLLACVCFIYSYQNKLIPEDYVTPILQAFFYCSLEKLPPRILARPGPTGITMSSHLMITLTHARWFLSLLGLHQELPLPSSVFQPYVYIPLHGTAFKLKQKEKFHGNDAPAKEYYELVSKNEEFQDFKECICSGSAIDNIGAVCVQYARTKDAIKELLDKKAQGRKTSKSKKK